MLPCVDEQHKKAHKKVWNSEIRVADGEEKAVNSSSLMEHYYTMHRMRLGFLEKVVSGHTLKLYFLKLIHTRTKGSSAGQ